MGGLLDPLVEPGHQSEPVDAEDRADVLRGAAASCIASICGSGHRCSRPLRRLHLYYVSLVRRRAGAGAAAAGAATLFRLRHGALVLARRRCRALAVASAPRDRSRHAAPGRRVVGRGFVFDIVRPVAVAAFVFVVALSPSVPDRGCPDLSYGLYLWHGPLIQLALLTGLYRDDALGFAAIAISLATAPRLARLARRRAAVHRARPTRRPLGRQGCACPGAGSGAGAMPERGGG